MSRPAAGLPRRPVRRLLLAGLMIGLVAPTDGARASDELAEELRREAETWTPRDGWTSPEIRALLETGATGRAVAVDLSRGGRRDVRILATELLARAEQEGGWIELLALERLRPVPSQPPPEDPLAERRALDELESELPQLEAEFPGELRPPTCGNAGIGEHSSVLGKYVRLGERACASLERLARDDDARRRQHALGVLATVECPHGVDVALRALGDADARVRREAVSLIDGTPAASCEHRDALRRVLSDPDPRPRIAAAGALAACGDVAALPALLASARVVAETDDRTLRAWHGAVFDDLRRLTSHVAPAGDGASFGRGSLEEQARWWDEWEGRHGADFDVLAAHLDALHAALDSAREHPNRAHAPRQPGRLADLGVLLELGGQTVFDLLLENLPEARRAGFDLTHVVRHLPPGLEGAVAGFERVARDERERLEARRGALALLSRIDPDSVRPLARSLLLSPRPSDRAAAWGVGRRFATEALRRAAHAALPSAGPGEAKNLYWDLRQLADAHDCATLLPIVMSETDLADQIAGWQLVAELGCQAAKGPMRARLSVPRLGSWLAQPLASYRDPTLIPDLPCVETPCSDPHARRRALLALSTCLDRRTVPGLVDALSDPDANIRLGAAVALREAVRERAEHPTGTRAGTIDFTWPRVDRPYVHAALERARARSNDPAAAVAHEALELLGASDAPTRR